MQNQERQPVWQLAAGSWGPVAFVAIAALASFVLLISLDSHLTFIADDWMLLVKRQGWGVSYFLDPFHGNIVLAPAFIYKVMREIFGMGSATPYYVAAILTFIASAVLLFAYLRRRVDDWLAVAAATLILFLGAAFEDLLFAFQIGYFASVAAGLGMLLALDREDEKGDWVACGLLVVSVAFSSVGLAFAAGAVVDLFMGRRPRAPRWYVAGIPIVLYWVWWAGWGINAQNHLSAHNVVHTPSFVFQAAAAGIVSLLGLATGDGSEPSPPHLIWGELILVALLIGLAWQIYRDRKISKGLAVALAIGIAFWAAAALNRDISRLPTSSRFQYPSAVFLLLIFGEMLKGICLPRLVLAPVAVVTALALWGGISLMHREWSERWEPYAESLRSTLAAVEVADGSVDPHFEVPFPPDIEAPAHAYLVAARDYGSPAYTESELEKRPQSEREGADVTLAQALGLTLLPAAGEETTVACQTLTASANGATGITLRHGRFTLTNRTANPVELFLGRFAEGYPVAMGELPVKEKTSLVIPADRSDRPWNFALLGSGPVNLCTTRSSAPSESQKDAKATTGG